MAWQVLDRGGEIRIGFVTKGGVVHNVGTTRYGSLGVAREAARAQNKRDKELPQSPGRD